MRSFPFADAGVRAVVLVRCFVWQLASLSYFRVQPFLPTAWRDGDLLSSAALCLKSHVVVHAHVLLKDNSFITAERVALTHTAQQQENILEITMMR